MKYRGSVLLGAALAMTVTVAAQQEEQLIQKQIERIKESDTSACARSPGPSPCWRHGGSARTRNGPSFCSRMTATSRRAAVEAALAT